MAENKIGMSGVNYIIPPKIDNPFWEDGDIAENLTATATVDNSTGTPSVDVTKNGYNLNFDFKNLKGEKGNTGAKGEKGDTGAQGPKGEKGDTGATGASPRVEQIPGSLGVSGAPAVNITDPENLKVAIVYNGEKGEKGDKGDKGDPGEAGATGPQGPQGKKGEKGDTGATGPQGPQGEIGPEGPAGIQGPKGDTGERGPQGPQGPQGEVGPQGPAGEVPNIDNVITEVSDNVYSGTTYRCDYHTIKQTKHDGTQNDVSTFTIAQKQIVGIKNGTISGYDTRFSFMNSIFKTVDQDGIGDEIEGTQIVRLCDGNVTYDNVNIQLEADRNYIFIPWAHLTLRYTDNNNVIYDGISGIGTSPSVCGTPYIVTYTASDHFVPAANLSPFNINSPFLTTSTIRRSNGKFIASFSIMGNRNQEVSVYSSPESGGNYERETVKLKDVHVSVNENITSGGIDYFKL